MLLDLEVVKEANSLVSVVVAYAPCAAAAVHGKYVDLAEGLAHCTQWRVCQRTAT